MRSLAVFAFCLLAAHASAWSVGEGIRCVSGTMGDAVERTLEDISSRVIKMSIHRDVIADKLSQEIAEIRKQFRENLEEEMEMQRSLAGDCTEGNIATRMACRMKRGLGIVSGAAGVARNSLMEAVRALRDHEQDFDGKCAQEMGDIVSSLSREVPRVLQASWKCFTESSEDVDQ
ncbi:uncharacterized protein LOC100904624 [Galendromus occidentalis]|uniref:Uncharacterized protein LOC100904624 n=1 Tax=Galendromus occidentalis TaxID=34638 RepID=A0AAJ6QVG0_9ACAR|nr:uncharacterized protein LOC100904624 [Galendromus occidentalis]